MATNIQTSKSLTKKDSAVYTKEQSDQNLIQWYMKVTVKCLFSLLESFFNKTILNNIESMVLSHLHIKNCFLKEPNFQNQLTFDTTIFINKQPNHNFTQQYVRVTANDLFSLLGTTRNTLLNCLSWGKYKSSWRVFGGSKELVEFFFIKSISSWIK